MPVTVISNHENCGFPAAINQVLQPARGEYLLGLNNDVVVTDRPAHQMMRNSQAAIQICSTGSSSTRKTLIYGFAKGSCIGTGENRPMPKTRGGGSGTKTPEQILQRGSRHLRPSDRRNLAVLAAERGDRGEEERLWRAVLAECPADGEALAKVNATARKDHKQD